MNSEHYRREGFREWFRDVGYLYLIVTGTVVVLFAVSELADVIRVSSGRRPATVSSSPYPEY